MFEQPILISVLLKTIPEFGLEDLMDTLAIIPLCKPTPLKLIVSFTVF